MHRCLPRVLLAAFLPAALLTFAPAVASARNPAPAEAWQTSQDLPLVDFSGLTPTQKATALRIMRQEECVCGCGMKVAQCRVLDPPCSYSRAFAAMIVKGVHEGKSPAQIHTLLAESELARRAAAANRILGDPVEIPIQGAPERGPRSARITVVEFSDFECPYCAQARLQIGAVMKAYPKDMRLVYKQFPLSNHPHAELAAEAALAAQSQNKFWPMHDKLFENFRSLSREHILDFARELGLDMSRFTADLNSGKYKKAVAKDVADGDNAGVEGTPSFFINGKYYRGQLDLAALKPILDAELKR
jgi:protein-disulfide isomerase